VPLKRVIGETGGGKSPALIVRPPGVRPPPRANGFTLKGEIAQVVGNMRKISAPGVVRVANEAQFTYGRLRTGILALDLGLAGGFRLSRGAMLYGNRSAGKSTVAYLTIAAAQRRFPDSVCVLLDIEGTHDPVWAAALGVDLARLIVLEPETGEHAVDMAVAVMNAQETACIVTDSIAMLTPMKEIDASAEDSLVGIHARLVGHFLRRMTTALLKQRHRGHTPLMLHLNQWRMKIGVMFGDPRTLPGGRALEFSTSQQVELYNEEKKAGGDDANADSKVKDDTPSSMVVYNQHSFKITKDKTGGKIKEGRFRISRDADATGIPVGRIMQAKTILDVGARCGLITGRYTLPGGQKLKSEAEAQKFFVEHPDVEDAVERDIVNVYLKKWGLDLVT
jgi:recombination protein RecA